MTNIKRKFFQTIYLIRELTSQASTWPLNNLIAATKA